MTASNPFNGSKNPFDASSEGEDRVGIESDNPFQSPESDFKTPAAGATIAYSGEKLNPWFSMMYRPRDTIRYIVATNVARHILLLAWLGGFVSQLNRALQQSQDMNRSLAEALVGCAIGGVFMGLLSVFLVPAVARWTSSLLGGVATHQQMRAAAAWSYIPLVWSLVPYSVLLALNGGIIFSIDFHRTVKGLPTILAVLSIAAFTFWQFILYFKLVSEVNQFSTWRAFWAMFLAGAIVIGPIIVIVLAVEFFQEVLGPHGPFAAIILERCFL